MLGSKIKLSALISVYIQKTHAVQVKLVASTNYEPNGQNAYELRGIVRRLQSMISRL